MGISNVVYILKMIFLIIFHIYINIFKIKQLKKISKNTLFSIFKNQIYFLISRRMCFFRSFILKNKFKNSFQIGRTLLRESNFFLKRKIKIISCKN